MNPTPEQNPKQGRERTALLSEQGIPIISPHNEEATPTPHILAPLTPLSVAANISLPRLRRISQCEEIPSLPEYEQLLSLRGFNLEPTCFARWCFEFPLQFRREGLPDLPRLIMSEIGMYSRTERQFLQERNASNATIKRYLLQLKSTGGIDNEGFRVLRNATGFGTDSERNNFLESVRQAPSIPTAIGQWLTRQKSDSVVEAFEQLAQKAISIEKDTAHSRSENLLWELHTTPLPKPSPHPEYQEMLRTLVGVTTQEVQIALRLLTKQPVEALRSTKTICPSILKRLKKKKISIEEMAVAFTSARASDQGQTQERVLEALEARRATRAAPEGVLINIAYDNPNSREKKLRMEQNAYAAALPENTESLVNQFWGEMQLWGVTKEELPYSREELRSLLRATDPNHNTITALMIEVRHIGKSRLIATLEAFITQNQIEAMTDSVQVLSKNFLGKRKELAVALGVKDVTLNKVETGNFFPLAFFRELFSTSGWVMPPKLEAQWYLDAADRFTHGLKPVNALGRALDVIALEEHRTINLFSQSFARPQMVTRLLKRLKSGETCRASTVNECLDAIEPDVTHPRRMFLDLLAKKERLSPALSTWIEMQVGQQGRENLTSLQALIHSNQSDSPNMKKCTHGEKPALEKLFAQLHDIVAMRQGDFSKGFDADLRLLRVLRFLPGVTLNELRSHRTLIEKVDKSTTTPSIVLRNNDPLSKLFLTEISEPVQGRELALCARDGSIVPLNCYAALEATSICEALNTMPPEHVRLLRLLQDSVLNPNIGIEEHLYGVNAAVNSKSDRNRSGKYAISDSALLDLLNLTGGCLVDHYNLTDEARVTMSSLLDNIVTASSHNIGFGRVLLQGVIVNSPYREESTHLSHSGTPITLLSEILSSIANVMSYHSLQARNANRIYDLAIPAQNTESEYRPME